MQYTAQYYMLVLLQDWGWKAQCSVGGRVTKQMEESVHLYNIILQGLANLNNFATPCNLSPNCGKYFPESSIEK